MCFLEELGKEKECTSEQQDKLKKNLLVLTNLENSINKFREYIGYEIREGILISQPVKEIKEKKDNLDEMILRISLVIEGILDLEKFVKLENIDIQIERALETKRHAQIMLNVLQNYIDFLQG